MRRPVIGICTPLEPARWAVWELPAYLVATNYVDAVRAAGGLVVLLPPDPVSTTDPGDMLDLLDGLLLIGGADIDPASYGAEKAPETEGTVPERDAFEIAMVRGALDRDLPVLGICRGMQLMNVARGGTLIQHVPGTDTEHRRVLGSFHGTDHDVLLEPGSLAARAAGEERHGTKSHHHQAVDAVGDGLVVTGRATSDGLAEAIEDPTRGYALGVQWHPEADPLSAVIGSLVAEASRRRNGR